MKGIEVVPTLEAAGEAVQSRERKNPHFLATDAAPRGGRAMGFVEAGDLLRSGGPVLLLLGTDSGTGGMGIVPGYSIHDELRILVENGFSPYEAIAAGTVNAAIVVDRMTGDGNFGAIEEGKRADLILVGGNPLEDVGNIREPLGVMAAGRWYSQETLAELIAPPEERTTRWARTQ